MTDMVVKAKATGGNCGIVDTTRPGNRL